MTPELFITTTVPRILAALGDARWERSADGTWKRGSTEVSFKAAGMSIDHALKPEILVGLLKKSRGRPFCRDGVGWGFYARGRWHVETWEGQNKSFSRKAEAQSWLDELEA